jgi:hypothetical protein
MKPLSVLESGHMEPQINADERRYKHAERTGQIIRVFFEVYNELGYGF